MKYWIVSTGACTSVGGARLSTAAFRAGLVRKKEMDSFTFNDNTSNEPMSIVGSPIQTICSGFESLARILILASEALKDLHANIGDALKLADIQINFSLYVPSKYRHVIEEEGGSDVVIDRILSYSQLSGEGYAVKKIVYDLADVVTLPGKHDSASGSAENIVEIIGAVDSLLNQEEIESLVAENRLKTPSKPDGLTPGEGAVFLLLTQNRALATTPVVLSELILEQVVQEMEGSEPVDGNKLSQSMLGVVQDMPVSGESINVYSNFCGASQTAYELSNAIIRFNQQANAKNVEVITPCQTFGSVGGADLFLAISLSYCSVSLGFANKKLFIVSYIGEKGLRISVSLLHRVM